MKRILLVTIISLSILTAGCGLKYRSCKEMPFEKARIHVGVGDFSGKTRGYLIFEKVFFKNEVLKIWTDIEKAKIEVKYQPSLNGTVLSIKPTFKELIYPSCVFLWASEVEIICGNQEDMIRWQKTIQNAKKALIDLRTQPRQVVPPEIY